MDLKGCERSQISKGSEDKMSKRHGSKRCERFRDVDQKLVDVRDDPEES